MGYGKTTLIREFLRLNFSGQVLWMSILDPSESDFWSSLCQRLASLDVGIAAELSELGLPKDPLACHQLVEILSRWEVAEETVFVWDDFHHLNSPITAQLLEILMRHLPAKLHFVATTRYTNLPLLDEYLLKGYAQLLDKNDLEFDESRIVHYFRLNGIELKEAEAAKIFQLSEGWISAIYLLLLHYLQTGNFDVPTNIYLLLEQSVFTRLPGESQQLLLNLCLFDEFTLEQARFVWDKPGLDELLSSLVARNAFVFYNAGTRCYQMHNILTIFLRDKLAASPQYSSCCQQAGQWFLAKGEHLSAMELFFLAKDFTGLLAALEQDKNKSIDDYRKFQLLLTFFEAIPAAILLAHPKSLLILAMTAFTFNEPGWMEKACQDFARAMQPLPPSEATTHLWGEFHILNSFTHYNDILAMARELEKAQSLMQRPTEFLDTSGSWSFGSPSIVLLFHREKGHLSEYEHAMRQSIHIYCELTQGHGAGGATLMEGEAAYLRGDFSRSESLGYKAQREASSHPSPAIRIGAMFLLLRLAIAQGHKEELAEILRQHHLLVESTRDPATVATLDLAEGFAFGLLGQQGRIASWLLDEAALAATLQFPCLPMGQIVLSRALLLQGEYSRILGNFPRHLEVARFFPNLLAEIYAHIFRAAACERLLRRPEAEATLAAALELAASDGLTMPFVENIDYLGALLQRCAHATSEQSFVQAILQQGASYHKGLTALMGEFQAPSAGKLTPRELEIARLVATGLANKEVAAQLFISPNTVKTLLKSIFEKLEIKSRALLAQALPPE